MYQVYHIVYLLDHAILCDLIPCDFKWFCSRNKNIWIILNSFWHRFWSFLEPAWSILDCLRICLTLFDCFVWLRWWPDQLRRVREDDDGQVSHERKLRAFQSLSCAQPTQLWCTEPVACSSRQQAVSWIAIWINMMQGAKMYSCSRCYPASGALTQIELLIHTITILYNRSYIRQ